MTQGNTAVVRERAAWEKCGGDVSLRSEMAMRVNGLAWGFREHMAQPLERCDHNTKSNRVRTGQENISVVIHPCLCRNAVDYRLLKFQYHHLGNTAPQPHDPKNGFSTKLLQRKRHERLQDQPCLAFLSNDSGCADTNKSTPRHTS